MGRHRPLPARRPGRPAHRSHRGDRAGGDQPRRHRAGRHGARRRHLPVGRDRPRRPGRWPCCRPSRSPSRRRSPTSPAAGGWRWATGPAASSCGSCRRPATRRRGGSGASRRTGCPSTAWPSPRTGGSWPRGPRAGWCGCGTSVRPGRRRRCPCPTPRPTRGPTPRPSAPTAATCWPTAPTAPCGCGTQPHGPSPPCCPTRRRSPGCRWCPVPAGSRWSAPRSTAWAGGGTWRRRWRPGWRGGCGAKSFDATGDRLALTSSDEVVVWDRTTRPPAPRRHRRGGRRRGPGRERGSGGRRAGPGGRDRAGRCSGRASALAPDGDVLALGTRASGDVYLVDVTDPAAPQLTTAPLPGRPAMVEQLAFRPDGGALAAGGERHRRAPVGPRRADR